MEAADLRRWLDGYIEVWASGDPTRVAELFTEDAVYVASPFETARHGHVEIAELWQERGDEPDAFEAAYAPLVVHGDVAVASGMTRYLDEQRTGAQQEYGNVFVLRFAADGRCREYREWYTLRPPAMEPEPVAAPA
jgi:ketosteroid isomerase-like protein